MAQQHIHCSVSNCYYWEAPHICVAEEILVTSDQLATEYGESVDAQLSGQVVEQHGLTPVPTCMATCCKTFRERSRGAGPIRKLTTAELKG